MLHRILLIAGLGFAIANPATARTINSASAFAEGGCSGYRESDQATDASARASGRVGPPGNLLVSGHCNAGSSALANGGLLSTIANAGNNTLNSFARAEANASSTAYLSITTPAGADPYSLIDIAARFDIAALLFANAPSASNQPQGSAVASYRFDYSLSGSQGQSNSDRTSGRYDWQEFEGFGTGGLFGTKQTISQLGVQSASIRIAPISGITLFMSAQSSAGASKCARCPGGIKALSDASNTASLAVDGPAFILPDGYFINAPELNIFNNYWIDPRIDVTPSTVPLPAGLPLLLVGLGALGLIRRVNSV